MKLMNRKQKSVVALVLALSLLYGNSVMWVSHAAQETTTVNQDVVQASDQGQNSDLAGKKDSSTIPVDKTTVDSKAEATTTETTTTQDTPAVLPESYGVLLMDGEETDLSFANTATQIIPLTITDDVYLTFSRTDTDSNAVSVVAQSTGGGMTTDTLSPIIITSGEDSSVMALTTGSYQLVFTGTLGASCKVKATKTLGALMEIGDDVKQELTEHIDGTPYYFQFTTKENGYLNIENKSGSTITVALCDEQKQNLTSASSLKKYSSSNRKKEKNMAGFGVLANQTYILKVTVPAQLNEISLATSMKYTKVKGSKKYYKTIGGSSFSGAKKLAKGKKLYITLAPDSEPQYFTFKKSSYRDMSLEIVALKNVGKVNMKLYYKEVRGSKKGKILPVKVNRKQIGLSVPKNMGKVRSIPRNWPNVTYYLEIKGSSSKATGGYQVKVN